jgi:phosphoribosylaminoimidazole (AIR) synthetase
LIDGSKLKPGQDVIGIQETSVRSNGLTDVRKILEHAFLMREMGSASKRDYLIRETRSDLQGQFSAADIGMILDAYTRRFPVEDYSHVPWHTMFPELTKKLLTPSTLYSPLIYNAQGGVDGEVRIPLVACAHVSGGGIPLKGKRMLESKGLGMNLEQKFQNPHGITELLQLAEQYPVNGEPIVTNTSASRKWNMGVGFLCVVESQAHGEELIKMALEMGYPGAAFLGKTTDKQIIHWRGEDWTYNRAESLKA